jgi:purine-nucleoside phosphorylase
MVIGKLDGYEVIAMQGRAHFYEGYDMQQITFYVRVLRALGIETLILTNAAGGLNPLYRPGDLMGITDHIFMPGMAGHNPLRGPNDDTLGLRFPAMLMAYTPALLDLAKRESRRLGITFHQGVYVMLAGPSFETRAELRYLRMIGGDAVGMSTAPETIVATHSSMRVLAISTITNTATGDGKAEANHQEVLEVGRKAGPRLAQLIKAIVAKL